MTKNSWGDPDTLTGSENLTEAVKTSPTFSQLFTTPEAVVSETEVIEGRAVSKLKLEELLPIFPAESVDVTTTRIEPLPRVVRLDTVRTTAWAVCKPVTVWVTVPDPTNWTVRLDPLSPTTDTTPEA
jgi:hypothetical protein